MDDKPKFGAGSDTSNQHPTPSLHNQSAQNTINHKIRNIFSTQPLSFWLKEYAFSVIAYVLIMGSDVMPRIIVLANLVLYPFAVLVLRSLGGNRKNNSIISSFFFGFSVAMVGIEPFWIVVYTVIRFIILLLRFTFSVLIGGLGLAYLLIHAN